MSNSTENPPLTLEALYKALQDLENIPLTLDAELYWNQQQYLAAFGLTEEMLTEEKEDEQAKNFLESILEDLDYPNSNSPHPKEPLATQQSTHNLARKYPSFSGVDIHSVLEKHYSEMKSISYPIVKDPPTVYSMGSIDPISFSRGKRGIVGTIVSLMLEENPLPLRDTYAKTYMRSSTTESQELPKRLRSKCDVCSEMFGTAGDLRIHRQNVHGWIRGRQPPQETTG